jgi:hypothetical protein
VGGDSLYAIVEFRNKAPTLMEPWGLWIMRGDADEGNIVLIGRASWKSSPRGSRAKRQEEKGSR